VETEYGHMRVSREDFEGLVAAAVEGLPQEFAEHLENVEFIVEDHPQPEDYGERGMRPGEVLLGVYRGVPLTKRSVFGGNLLPDQITIFQRPIERLCNTPAEVIREVRHTVLHEVAHHLGISDERLNELGYESA
jgi:predicted Zn-dependent protease with MMP-like domain